MRTWKTTEDNGPSKRPRKSQTWDPRRGKAFIERQELGLLTFAERLGLLSLAENVESLDNRERHRAAS